MSGRRAIRNMAVMDTPSTTPATPLDEEAAAPEEALIDDEMVVEEISIDGMCGVY